LGCVLHKTMEWKDGLKLVIDNKDTVVRVFASEGTQTNTQRMSETGTGPVAQLQGMQGDVDPQ